MKALYKLKTSRYSNVQCMSLEKAMEEYNSSGRFYKRVPCGFFSRLLTFEDWLQWYHIEIL